MSAALYSYEIYDVSDERGLPTFIDSLLTDARLTEGTPIDLALFRGRINPPRGGDVLVAESVVPQPGHTNASEQPASFIVHAKWKRP